MTVAFSIPLLSTLSPPPPRSQVSAAAAALYDVVASGASKKQFESALARRDGLLAYLTVVLEQSRRWEKLEPNEAPSTTCFVLGDETS